MIAGSWDAGQIPDATSQYAVTTGPSEFTAYNALGQQQYNLDFKGQKVECDYEPLLNRVRTKNLYGAGSSTPDDQVSYRYDELGRSSQVLTSHGTWTYGYDRDGRLTQAVTPQGTLHYGYDPATGRHTRTWTTAAGQTVSDLRYDYEELGRLKLVSVVARDGVVLSQPEDTTYTYTVTPTVSKLTERRPNGVTTVSAFDQRDRLASVEHTNAQGAELAGYTSRLRQT